MHGGEAESSPVPLTRNTGEQEQAFTHRVFRKAAGFRQRKDFLVEHLQPAAHANQGRPQIPPTLVARIIRHLPIAAAAKPPGPRLAQMSRHVRKNVAPATLNESKEWVGKVLSPTFGMSLLEFPDQFREIGRASTKRQAF